MLTFFKRSHGQKVVSSINSENKHKWTWEHGSALVASIANKKNYDWERLRIDHVSRERMWSPQAIRDDPPGTTTFKAVWDFLQCFFLSSFYTFYCTFTILICVRIFSFLFRVIIFRWSSSKSKLPFKTITKTKLVEKIEYCFSGGVWEF